jgi:hypothetical protein
MKNELFIVMNDGRKISVSGFQNTEEMVSFCSAIDSDLFDYNNIMMNDDSTDEAESDDYYDDSMDGDFDSAMRDAGHGTDEDYGYYGEDYITDKHRPQASTSHKLGHKPAQAQATNPCTSTGLLTNHTGSKEAPMPRIHESTATS